MNLLSFWSNLSPKTKYEIRSWAHTFFAAAMAEWSLTGFHLPDSKTALAALVATLARAGVKAVSLMIWRPVDPQVAPEK